MANSVTVRDVALGASVSVATVSRVLNNHAHVKDTVRQRVLNAAKELGYSTSNTHHSNETRASAKQIKEIGFVYCSSFDSTAMTVNPFWSRILHGAEREASRSNIKITYRTFQQGTEAPIQVTNAIGEMHLGGLLLVGPAEAEVVQAVRSTGLPLVLVDNYVAKAGVDSILSDNFEGARQAVEYLIGQGHQRIAFIGGPTVITSRPINKIYTIERRAAGYRTALLDAGLPVNYDLYEAGSLNPEGGYLACQRLLSRGHNFTALFCANDDTAIGAMKALREAAIRVPDEISVVGFDDIDMAEHYNPALTTVGVNKEAMGAAAVKTLLSRTLDPLSLSATIMLDVDLINRGSVARKWN